jgi:LacI family transcriptional regulator
MAAAARLGYQRNWAARALASGSSGLVAFVLADMPDTHLGTVLRWAEGRLRQSGYASLLAVAKEPDERSALIDVLLGREAEAVLLVGAYPSSQEIAALATRAVPWLALTDGLEDEPGRIDFGRAAGAELAARYLLDLGHERLAVVAPPGSGSPRGVRRALAGREGGFIDVVVADSDPNVVKVAIHRLLERPGRPTALVCATDADALVAVRKCLLSGLQVPQHLSIIGFGDEPFARSAMPALTTVRVSAPEIGLHAAEALLALLEGMTIEAQFKPSIKLAIRETSGPPH